VTKSEANREKITRKRSKISANAKEKAFIIEESAQKEANSPGQVRKPLPKRESRNRDLAQ